MKIVISASLQSIPSAWLHNHTAETGIGWQSENSQLGLQTAPHTHKVWVKKKGWQFYWAFNKSKTCMRWNICYFNNCEAIKDICQYFQQGSTKKKLDEKMRLFQILGNTSWIFHKMACKAQHGTEISADDAQNIRRCLLDFQRLIYPKLRPEHTTHLGTSI